MIRHEQNIIQMKPTCYEMMKYVTQKGVIRQMVMEEGREDGVEG